MGSNYEKCIYNQLMEVMAHLDTMENKLHIEKQEHKEEVDYLNKKINDLIQENQLLRDDNTRLKDIIHYDSSNTSLPPSTDQKGGKFANTYNGREKTKRKCGGQKGHKGIILTRSEVAEKIKGGTYKHNIQNIGDASSQKYITKYVVDLSITPVVTEIRIYADSKGNYHVPEEYRSDVIYGSNGKALAIFLYSEGVMSNDQIAAFLNTVGKEELRLSIEISMVFVKSLRFRRKQESCNWKRNC